MRRWLWLLVVGLTGALWGTQAWAVYPVPKEMGETYVANTFCASVGGVAQYGGSAQAAGEAVAADCTARQYLWVTSCATQSSSTVTRNYYVSAVNATTISYRYQSLSTHCFWGNTTVGDTPLGSSGWSLVQALTCPMEPPFLIEETPGGAMCICDPGVSYWDEAQQTCVPISCKDKLRLHQLANCPYSYGMASCSMELAPGQRKACLNGCPVAFQNVVGWEGHRAGVGIISEGEGACTEEHLPPPPETEAGEDLKQCPVNTCPGTVNGASVCVACAKSETHESTTTNVDGSKETTSTTCEGGVCTTTTKNTDANGLPAGEKTTIESLSSYCSRFPLSGHCSGVTNNGGGTSQNTSGGGSGGSGECTGEDCGEPGSSWGGNCAASFTCDGDAVQCAIAKDQHVRHCQLFEDENPLSQIGGPAMDGNPTPQGHPRNEAQSTSMEFGTIIDQSNPLGGSCPSDQSISVASATVTLPWSKLCGSFQMLGNLIVGVSMLAAAFIVFRS